MTSRLKPIADALSKTKKSVKEDKIFKPVAAGLGLGAIATNSGNFDDYAEPEEKEVVTPIKQEVPKQEDPAGSVKVTSSTPANKVKVPDEVKVKDAKSLPEYKATETKLQTIDVTEDVSALSRPEESGEPKISDRYANMLANLQKANAEAFNNYKKEKDAIASKKMWQSLVNGITTLMTGLYAAKHGLDISGFKLDEDDFAQEYRAAQEELSQSQAINDKQFTSNMQILQQEKSDRAEKESKLQADRNYGLSLENLKLSKENAAMQKAMNEAQIKLQNEASKRAAYLATLDSKRVEQSDRSLNLQEADLNRRAAKDKADAEAARVESIIKAAKNKDGGGVDREKLEEIARDLEDKLGSKDTTNDQKRIAATQLIELGDVLGTSAKYKDLMQGNTGLLSPDASDILIRNKAKIEEVKLQKKKQLKEMYDAAVSGKMKDKARAEEIIRRVGPIVQGME